MTANPSNLTPEQRLDAMVYKVAPWAPNPAEFNKAAAQIALSLLEKCDVLEARAQGLKLETETQTCAALVSYMRRTNTDLLDCGVCDLLNILMDEQARAALKGGE